MNNSKAILLLADGSTYSGQSIGISGISVGEVVFNTSMTGYQEIITDPSYESQIITFTNPHIGNTGINFEDFESTKSHVSGIVIRDIEILANNWRKKDSLRNFLKDQNIVAISGIDTRKLTKHLRKNGSQNGCIVSGKVDLQKAKESLNKFNGLKGVDLAIKVTTNEPYEWTDGRNDIYKLNQTAKLKNNFHVVAYDFGIKHNILRILNDLGCKLTIVPANYSAEKVLRMKPDGIFLSNGPGDPEACDYAIKNIELFLNEEIPMFGICLGFQLLALASGAKTIKMKFGHHGANHPVMNVNSKKVFITSQNHGFMVDQNTLPSYISVTHISLFDQSLQGFEIKEKYSFGFQGHPEASPGPEDINNIFNNFIMNMKEAKNVKK